MSLSTLVCFLTLTLSLLVLPHPTEGQQPAKIFRLGVLSDVPPLRRQAAADRLRHELHTLGYVEGQHITFEWRFADTKTQYGDLLAELIGLPVDYLVVQSTPMALAAKQATSTIPIVAVAMADPVGTGLVASLARPGGNLTGLTHIAAELSPKALELLKETIPGITRVAVFHCGPQGWESLQGPAQHLGLHLHALEVQSPALDHFTALFAAAVHERADALLVLNCRDTVALPREQLAALAMQHRLPAIYPWKSAVIAGGLMSYGHDITDRPRHVARYVDQILKGAHPADLPVERSMRFELVINLKTAAALGITVPPMLLFQATEVIR